MLLNIGSTTHNWMVGEQKQIVHLTNFLVAGSPEGILVNHNESEASIHY